MRVRAERPAGVLHDREHAVLAAVGTAARPALGRGARGAARRRAVLRGDDGVDEVEKVDGVLGEDATRLRAVPEPVAGGQRRVLRLVLDGHALERPERVGFAPRDERLDDRVEAQHKVHGRDARAIVAGLDQRVSAFEAERDRLLDEQVLAGRERGQPHLGVQVRRRRDGHEVHVVAADEVAPVRDARDVVGHALERRDGDDACSPVGLPGPVQEAAEAAVADQSDAERIHCVAQKVCAFGRPRGARVAERPELRRAAR